jgi:hypothetical protein
MPITRFQTPAMIVMQPRIWMLPMTIQRMAEVRVSSRISFAISSAGRLWRLNGGFSCPSFLPQPGQKAQPSGTSFPQLEAQHRQFSFLNKTLAGQIKVGARNKKAGRFRRMPNASTTARITQSGVTGTGGRRDPLRIAQNYIRARENRRQKTGRAA